MAQHFHLPRHIPPQVGKFQIGLSPRVISSEQGQTLAFGRLFQTGTYLSAGPRFLHCNTTIWRQQRSPLCLQTAPVECRVFVLTA